MNAALRWAMSRRDSATALRLVRALGYYIAFHPLVALAEPVLLQFQGTASTPRTTTTATLRRATPGCGRWGSSTGRRTPASLAGWPAPRTTCARARLALVILAQATRDAAGTLLAAALDACRRLDRPLGPGRGPRRVRLLRDPPPPGATTSARRPGRARRPAARRGARRPRRLRRVKPGRPAGPRRRPRRAGRGRLRAPRTSPPPALTYEAVASTLARADAYLHAGNAPAEGVRSKPRAFHHRRS